MLKSGQEDASLDWALIGINVRRARILRGFTQADLAERARVGISTVYHAEQGRPLSRRSFEAICEGLGSLPDHIRARGRRHLTDDLTLLVHRQAEGVWTSQRDLRIKTPDDNLARIQNPEERIRLGRLGLVPQFLCAATFIMPEGPGPLFLELYGRNEGAINQTIYRDCLLMCQEGGLRARVGDEETTLGPGDLLGYRSRDLRWMEPVGDRLPARLLWIGAVRLGKLPSSFGPGVRVRSRRAA